MLGPVLDDSRRLAGRLLGWALRLAFVGAVVFASLMLAGGFNSRSGPTLQPWHTLELESEYRPGRPGMPVDWAGYLELEAGVFEEFRTRLSDLHRSAKVDRWSRYRPDSPSYPLASDRDWNRSFTFEAAATPRGAIVLVHGLTDSPYSVRAVGELFAERGLHVVAPRMPGHGTHPGGLLDSRVEAWRDVVRMAVEEGCRLAGGGDFYLGGYSTGAALALDWTLARLEAGQARGCFPRRIFMFSPAVEITSFAALAASHRFVASLPWFHQFHWSPILPEYDPWKYNSFPKVAGHEVWRLTGQNRAALDRLAARGRLDELPPITAFQSLVDNTVLTRGLVRGLFDRVHNAESELVLFDMNRYSGMQTFLAGNYDDVLAGLWRGPPRPFRSLVVSNLAPESEEVALWQREPGEGPDPEPEVLGLAWPREVYSLSHVALVFPPDDPTYGEHSDLVWFPGLSRPRGEVGVLAVPLELFMRLRWNPFFPVIERRIDAALAGP